MIKTANIAGAGIGGLTAAIALAQRGVSVRIFEQVAMLAEVGAGLQLSPNAMKVLVALGLGDAIRKLSFEPEHATIRNGSTGRPYVSVPLKGQSDRAFGAPYLHVHRADLHGVLHAEAMRLGVSIVLGKKIDLYNENEFAGVEPADISVDASGVKSAIATQMNPQQPATFTGQIAWRGLIPTDDLPPNVIPPDATVWTGRGKHIVTYYVQGGSMINFVAVEERESWPDADWTTQGDLNVLCQAFEGWHPKIQSLLGAAHSTNIWALHDKPTLERWSNGRVVLLGDACHPTLPFLAQGAAMAIEDAFVLARCVTQIRGTRTALKRYEYLRKPRTDMLQAKARANADVFHFRGPLGGVVSQLKLNVARLLPASLAMIPFRSIYAYDAVNQTD